MPLHIVMLCWAVLALALAGAALAVIMTRKTPDSGTPGPLRTLPKTIFDFSAGQVEGRQMQALLTAALSEAATDAEFESNFRKTVAATTGLGAENSWAWLNRLLAEYRHANEFDASPRELAVRFLEDIPHRYRLRDAPSEPPQPQA